MFVFSVKINMLTKLYDWLSLMYDDDAVTAIMELYS